MTDGFRPMMLGILATAFVLAVPACKPRSGETSHVASAQYPFDDVIVDAIARQVPRLGGEEKRKLTQLAQAVIALGLGVIDTVDDADLRRVYRFLDSLPGDTAQEKIARIEEALVGLAEGVKSLAQATPEALKAASQVLTDIRPRLAAGLGKSADKAASVTGAVTNGLNKAENALDRVSQDAQLIARMFPGDFEGQFRRLYLFYYNFGGPGSLPSRKLATAEALVKALAPLRARMPANASQDAAAQAFAQWRRTGNLASLIDPDYVKAFDALRDFTNRSPYIDQRSLKDFFENIHMPDFDRVVMAFVDQAANDGLFPYGWRGVIEAVYVNDPFGINPRAIIYNTLHRGAQKPFNDFLTSIGARPSLQPETLRAYGGVKRLSDVVPLAARLLTGSDDKPYRALLSFGMARFKGSRMAPVPGKVVPLSAIRFPKGIPVGKLDDFVHRGWFPHQLVIAHDGSGNVLID